MQEIQFLEELQEHLDNEFWLCQSCNKYFHKNATNYMYDPLTCPECIEENINNFEISYNEIDMEPRKGMKKIIKNERNGLKFQA